MKLLMCVECWQVFSLTQEYVECSGGHAGGQYLDRVNAAVWGPRDRVFVIGFDTGSFALALRAQAQQGDSTAHMHHAGGLTPRGRDFSAFVIPDAAASVRRYASKEAFRACHPSGCMHPQREQRPQR